MGITIRLRCMTKNLSKYYFNLFVKTEKKMKIDAVAADAGEIVSTDFI